jgi:hypothetical protein
MKNRKEIYGIDQSSVPNAKLYFCLGDYRSGGVAQSAGTDFSNVSIERLREREEIQEPKQSKERSRDDDDGDGSKVQGI